MLSQNARLAGSTVLLDLLIHQLVNESLSLWMSSSAYVCSGQFVKAWVIQNLNEWTLRPSGISVILDKIHFNLCNFALSYVLTRWMRLGNQWRNQESLQSHLFKFSQTPTLSLLWNSKYCIWTSVRACILKIVFELVATYLPF